MRVREIAQTGVPYGYRKIRVLLNREGWKVGQYLVERIYREEGLTLRQRRKRHRRVAVHRRERQKPSGPNQVWSLDFVADQLADGRRIRALTVVDVFTREGLAAGVEGEPSSPGSRGKDAGRIRPSGRASPRLDGPRKGRKLTLMRLGPMCSVLTRQPKSRPVTFCKELGFEDGNRGLNHRSGMASPIEVAWASGRTKRVSRKLRVCAKIRKPEDQGTHSEIRGEGFLTLFQLIRANPGP